jgi:transposase
MAESGIQVTQLQHLGLVAGMCNEIGLIDCIDRFIQKPKRKVSVGQAVQAMVLNGLGFTGRALYLTPRFFKNRPVETLIGEGITADDLHDDCLGTALDALYEKGITELFYHIAGQALARQNIEYRFVHLDSTTFSLHGQYDGKQADDPDMVTITKGYSKDRAPDLNQVVTTLMCSHRSTLPVWLEVLSGNASDKTTFRESIRKFRAQFDSQALPYFVADSALYSKDSITELDGIKWVTRVPETLALAKQAIDEVDIDAMNPCPDKNYRYSSRVVEYGTVKQRWITVFSRDANARELNTFERKQAKMRADREKDFWHLSNRPFACEADGRKAAQKFDRELTWHQLKYSVDRKLSYGAKGRPSKDMQPTGETWYISGELSDDVDKVSQAVKRKGLFIIATNELDESVLSDQSLIDVYKAQGVSVERGFRFLKDPMFYAESLYLNSPKRIMALIMVMSLSLLVYSLLERKLRKELKSQKLAIASQVNKPTDNPTIRWVFQCFEDIAIYKIEEHTPRAANMDDQNETVLKALGPPTKKYIF